MSEGRMGQVGRQEHTRKILMAIDFGTTFSGIAWAQTRKPEVQTAIMQWPDATSGGLEGVSKDKVPTELQYDGQDYKWGFQIGEDEQRHQWFKLDLDPSQRRDTSQLARLFPDPKAAPPGYDMPPEKLSTDYLTAIRKHGEQVLRYKLPSSALQSLPIEYIITVPAVWSDAAQARTRLCAEQAGMGLGHALHIISEPEAAAVYALDVLDPHIIEIGDTFVLCDAGGGTVDLISYTVTALKPNLEINEATPGIGSLCGSAFLNRRFEKFLEDKLGKEPGWDQDVLDEATKRFEAVVKKQFRGIEGEEFKVPVHGLPDNPRLGISRGKLTLSGDEVGKIFEPIVHEVNKLVMDQVRSTTQAAKKPKAVVMVGGFGQSAYLRDCIRSIVASFSIEVLQSPNGWTAVVRGALMKGLATTSPNFASVKISGRCARKHYGLEIQDEFIQGVHDEDRRSFSPFKGKDVIDIMYWFIKKVQNVQEDTPIRIFCQYLHLEAYGHPSEIVVTINAFSDRENSGAPMYPDSEGVARLVDVKADLSPIPLARFPKATGADGHSYLKVDFHIEITCYSAYTKFELIHGGKNYGPVAAEYV
ncbi:MAG: hypothetical protein ASARMPRED_001863 [Alectoria sarmentosa]|nr:MAG: hypothetical protein ASARMPRED_001863 [Alectoria sarmentosa]